MKQICYLGIVTYYHNGWYFPHLANNITFHFSPLKSFTPPLLTFRLFTQNALTCPETGHSDEIIQNLTEQIAFQEFLSRFLYSL